jgi:CHAT domain-containing protein
MAEQANILHLSAHGMTVVSDYHKSQLRLGESVALTYSDIMDRFHLQQNCVAILSACEAGYSPSRMKRAAWDEYVGLDGAFVQAGARAVVSSVWMAYDRPTALLMYLLHRNLKMGAGSATALAEAQRSLLRGTWRTDRTVEEFNRFHAKQPDVPPLRASEDFSAPIFWAGFKHLGIPRKQ